jgi:hypothetical protein
MLFWILLCIVGCHCTPVIGKLTDLAFSSLVKSCTSQPCSLDHIQQTALYNYVAENPTLEKINELFRIIVDPDMQASIIMTSPFKKIFLAFMLQERKKDSKVLHLILSSKNLMDKDAIRTPPTGDFMLNVDDFISFMTFGHRVSKESEFGKDENAIAINYPQLLYFTIDNFNVLETSATPSLIMKWWVLEFFSSYDKWASQEHFDFFKKSVQDLYLKMVDHVNNLANPADFNNMLNSVFDNSFMIGVRYI